MTKHALMLAYTPEIKLWFPSFLEDMNGEVT